MNDQPESSSQAKPMPTPAPESTAAAGSAAPRQDYSSSAGDEPGFEGTAASLESLPVGEAMQEMVETARQIVREHPLAAVAAGVLVGMVLGRR